jgi:hypothetical protein
LDTCDNEGRCVQLIRVNDSIPPSITCPAPTTVACRSDVPSSSIIIASDNCGGIPITALVKDSIPVADSSCLNNLIIYRTYSATDECGNVSFCTQQITVKDSIPPTIIGVPRDTSVICADDIQGPVGPAVEAIDNCGSVRLSYIKQVLDSTCINHKTILNIWIAIDTCQNITRDTFIIRINDTVPPQIINVPRDTTVFCAVDIPLVVTAGVFATDNCILVRLNYYRQVLDSTCINHKRILNIWVATDTCQNISRDTQAIQVIDTFSSSHFKCSCQ